MCFMIMMLWIDMHLLLGISRVENIMILLSLKINWMYIWLSIFRVVGYRRWNAASSFESRAIWTAPGSLPWSIFLFSKRVVQSLHQTALMTLTLVQIPPALILRIAVLVMVACAALLPSMGPCSCQYPWSFTHLPLPNWEKSSLLTNMQRQNGRY